MKPEREWTRTTTNRRLYTLRSGDSLTANEHERFGLIRVHATRLATAYADAEPQPVRMNDPQVVRNDDEVITFSPSRVFDPNSYPSGGVGMIGTARDYLIFLEALRTRNNPILQPESIELMTKNAIGALPAPSLDPGWRFGLGFAVLEDPKPTASPRNPGSWRWGGVLWKQFLG